MLLTIDKLIYGGDGLARLPADANGPGKTVFLPFVLAGEKIEASLTEQKPGFARAQVDAIIENSPRRIPPACPYFSQCGGCHYQHTTYEHQLEIKQAILRETLRRTAKLELPGEIRVHPSPPWNYRNRSRLQVHAQPEFKLGYFRPATQELLGVDQCPISSPLINRGITVAWGLGRQGKVPEGVSEIEFLANADDSQVLVEVGCSSDARRAAVRTFAEELRAAMTEIVGVVAFRESSQPHRSSRKSPSQEKRTDRGAADAVVRRRSAVPGPVEKLITVGADHLVYQTRRASYRVSAGSFFQANRHLIDDLVGIVTDGQSGESALDLYAGVGLFSTVLARDIRHIVSVESSQTSSADLAYNQTSNGETVQATTEQYLTRLKTSGRSGTGAVLPHISYQPGLAVVDPPRSGLGEPVARLLANLGAPRVIYVSCDPATLARDLVPLLAAGYQVERAHLVDLFPQTYHLESVLHLRK